MSVNERQLLCIFCLFVFFFVYVKWLQLLCIKYYSLDLSPVCHSVLNLTHDGESHSKFHDEMCYKETENSSVPTCFACQIENIIELAHIV